MWPNRILQHLLTTDCVCGVVLSGCARTCDPDSPDSTHPRTLDAACMSPCPATCAPRNMKSTRTPIRVRAMASRLALPDRRCHLQTHHTRAPHTEAATPRDQPPANAEKTTWHEGRTSPPHVRLRALDAIALMRAHRPGSGKARPDARAHTRGDYSEASRRQSGSGCRKPSSCLGGCRKHHRLMIAVC